MLTRHFFDSAVLRSPSTTVSSSHHRNRKAMLRDFTPFKKNSSKASDGKMPTDRRQWKLLGAVRWVCDRNRSKRSREHGHDEKMPPTGVLSEIAGYISHAALLECRETRAKVL